MSTEPTTAFSFGEWVVEPKRNRLTRDDESVTLEPLTMKVLEMLLEDPGSVIPTDEILDSLWRGRNAEPAMVARCIAQIRRALGDDAQAPTYIETVRKRGYRAIAAVASTAARRDIATPAEETPSVSLQVISRFAVGLLVVVLFAIPLLISRDETTTTQQRQQSIAVLPFKTEGPDSAENVFGEGVAEELIIGLSRAPGLKVIARTSAFEYDGAQDYATIGAALGVRHIVHGTLKQTEGRLRVNVHLTDAETNQVLWGEQYDERALDVFALQDEITQSVLTELRLRLDTAAARATVAPGAYDAYLRGRYFQSRIGYRPEHSRRFFIRAIELEGDYAAAHASLGWTYMDAVNLGYRRPDEGVPLAQASFDRALALDPDNVEAQLGVAVSEFMRTADFQLLLDQSAELLARDPTHWRVHLIYSGVLRVLERHDAALAVCNHWVRVDPLNTRARVERAAVLGHGLGRTSEALRDLDFVTKRTGTRPFFVEVQMAVDSGDLEWLERIAGQWRRQDGAVPDLVMAKLHYAKGNAEDVRNHAEAALAAGEDPWEVLLLLGRREEALAIAGRMLAGGSTRVMRAIIEPEREGRLAIPNLATAPGVESVRAIGRLDEDSLSKLVIPPPP